MSNFCCEICNTAILEDKGGRYVTECKHYPLDWDIKKAERTLLAARPQGEKDEQKHNQAQSVIRAPYG